MDHFLYKNQILHAENVPIPEIAQSVGTPFYVYSQATLLRHFEVFQEALSPLPHKLFYSVKANSNQAILTLLAKAGSGMDIVSLGEYERAIHAGVAPENIVFSGVGKTREELRTTLEKGIYQYNVESLNELHALNEIAISLGKKAPIAIRVNPDVDAKTHEKISTGKAENKFGIPFEETRDVYALAANMAGIEIVGIDTHIGSQLTSLEPFDLAFAKIADLLQILRADGHNIRRVDLGGGLGIPYQNSNTMPPLPFDYGKLVEKHFAKSDVEIGIEPGRLIAGNAGILVSSVIYFKRAIVKNFLIVDAAMNDLLRPAMYDSYHDIIPVEQSESAELLMDIVGPVCETGDKFASARNLPELDEGALIAMRSAGAYGAVMASEYNSRPLIPEVLVSGEQFSIIRKRNTIDEMIARDHIPDWL